MERYSEYKDSGVKWLGEIPNHWELLKSKYLWKETFENSTSGKEDLLSVSQYTGVTKSKADSRSESLIGYKIVHKDDLVINIMLAWLGGLGVSNDEGVVSPAYCTYKLIRDYNPKFLHYLYKTPMYLAEFARHSTGVVPSRWRMYTDDFGQVVSLLPPVEEQDAIVLYLDAATSKIDKAIAMQQKMIDLLNERKQIIIQNAVTKGLDENVEMKDSGVECFGLIPSHWKVIGWNHIFENLDKLREPISAEQRSRNNPKYDYYGASGVIDKIDYYNVDDKVLLIGEDGANLKMRNLPLVYKASGKIWVNNHAHILKPKVDSYDYMAYLMELFDYNPYITGSAQPKLSQEQLGTIRLCIPPIDEQNKIAIHLNRHLHGFDSAITNCQRQIALLQERKQIIINEVVTGKVKVS